MRMVLAALMLLAALAPALAVEPDEVLSDPVLEARARALSAQLRCLVCQNQSIDNSDAPLARDLRILVRERLTGGETDAQVINYLVDRYGQFVLLKPKFGTHTYILWLAPIAFLGCGLLAIFVLFRRRRQSVVERPLSDDEARALRRALDPGAPVE
jgi:cytochrome c-type biogenesis protein CcmH